MSAESQRRLDRAGAVAPQAADRVEAVVAEELPALAGDEPDGLDDVVEDVVAR